MHYKIKRYKLRTRRYARKVEHRYRNHPKIVPILAGIAVLGIAVVLAITLRDSAITISRTDANIVVLHADKESRTIPTREETVGAFLEKVGIVLNEGDVVEPSKETKIEEDDFRVNVYRAAPVVIVDADKRIMTYSAAQTSRSIADQAGLSVFPEDILHTVPSTDFLRDGIGQKVVIVRSTPVNLNLYGTALQLRTHAKTVGQLLQEKNVVLEPDDNVLPTLDTALTDKIEVFVTRFGKQIETQEETIPMPIQTVDDMSLSFGTTVIRQLGSPGKRSVTFELELKNDVVVGRKRIQEVIVQEPVAQIVAKGKAISIPGDKTAAMNAAGIAGGDHAYVNYIVSRESKWNVLAQNASSGAYGLCQALPGDKMAPFGSDWRTNAVTQLKWCNSYAVGRYGSWSAAYNFWVEHHWW